MVWYAFQGTYDRLPEAWGKFGKELRSVEPSKLSGPPGDVYVCDPAGNKGTQETMITILWAPLKP